MKKRLPHHGKKHPIGRTPKIHRLTCIWDKAPHNALTDLIFFKGHFLCCFRESDKHVGGHNGKIRILKGSSDGADWTSIALIELPGVDLRDPNLSITPEGRLMLLMGGAIYDGNICVAFNPHVTFSDNGSTWDKANNLHMPNEWIWKVTWHEGIGYGMSYFMTDLADVMQPWILKLFRTEDGKKFSLVKQFDISQHPSEAILRFNEHGTMIALLRRRGEGWIGSASPPYVDWEWISVGRRIGGPNFLILPGGELWICSRIYQQHGKKQEPHTALSLLTSHGLDVKLILPSGGDTSYGGMVYLEDALYTCYYSSHEGKAKIYFAEIRNP